MPKDNESLPPEHIGHTPAGHKRDEEARRRADDLAEKQQAAADDPDGLQPIDPAKFRKIDNEIASRIGRDGQIHISGMQPGMRYVFHKHADTCSTDEAKSAVRFSIDAHTRIGWMPVQGNDPEARELIGNDCASGGTLRGWGDDFLMAIREEYAQAQDARNARKQAIQGAVEERTRLLGAQHGAYAEAGAGRFDPNSRLGRFYPGDLGQPETIKVMGKFTEGDVRRGSIDPQIVNAIGGGQFAGPSRR